MAEEGFMVMTNWETGAQIGWWVQVGRHELGDGLVSDWCPEYETGEEGRWKYGTFVGCGSTPQAS
jgi:hypothetical protein